MHSGLMEAVESGKAFLSEGKGVADNVVDVSSAEAIDALLDQSTGSNAFGINKAKIIGQAIRALNSLVSSGYGYDAKTGGGVRVFIAKTNADYVAATEKARGKAHKGRGIFVDRIGKDGKKEGYDIYINLEAASALTVSHEVMHFYLVNAFGENPELFKSFAGSMSNLLRASDVQYLANFVKEYDESQAPEEYLTEMGAIITNRIARGNVTPKEQGLFAKIADLVNSTIYKITKGKLGYSIDTTSKTAVQEFFEGLAGAIADGKSFDQTLAEAAKEEVTQQKKKDAVQEPTTTEVGAQPSRTEGVREEGGGGVRPGVQGTQATQEGGAQSEVTPAASLPQEIQSLDDNQVVTLTYQSLDEVPEVLRTKAKSVKGADTEITTRKSILGIPVGKETKIKTPAKEYYVVVASGAEIKQAAQEQLAINQPTAPTTETIPSPTDITTKEQNILAVYDETGFITSDSWAAALANNRQYLDKVIESILKAREVLKNGKVTTRGTASAYLITVASMGSSGTKYEVWSNKHGKKLSSAFIENNDGVEWLRPEGIAAAYLSTEKGKKLLDAIDSNTATEKQVREFISFIGLGYQNSKTENIMKTLKSGGIKKMTDLFNTNKGSDFDQLYKGAIDNLYGIKTGKTGFFNQFLGVASRGVVDAREYNAWIAGVMKLSKAQQEFRDKAEKSPKLQAILLDRIKEVGLKLGYSDDIAAYIAHHAIWDSVANEVNTHTAEYEVVLRNLGVTDESIDLSVNDLGLNGVVDSKNAVKSKAQEISSELKRFKQNKNVKSKSDVPISQFDGKRFNVMESDRLVGAYIEDDQKNVVYRFYGGVTYPYITGKWWASRKLSTARSIATNANNNRDKDGYIYSAPMVGLPTQHMSNEDMLVTTIRLMRQDALAKGKGVTKEELISYISKAFNKKSIKAKNKILEGILNKNKTINTLFDELEFYLLQGGNVFVDKQGNPILDERGEKIQNFTFENRVQIVQGILGDPKVKSPKFPSVGSMSQMAKRFEEPITAKAKDVGDLVAVYRTKGTLVAKQTSTSDPFYHRSYPAEIYAVDENGNPAKIEVFYLDAAYRLRSVLPVLRKSDGGLFDFEEYSRRTSKGKQVTPKFAISNYARTAKLSRASGIVTSVLSKAQEIPSTIVVDGKTVSTVNNEGTQIFDNEQGIKNFWKWYSESNQLEDGKPIVWMHGTAARFEEFEPKQARAVFLTREENFADHFSDLSFNWMVGHPDKFLTKEALLDAYDNAIKYAKELNSAYRKHERLRAKANKIAKQIKQEYGKIDADVKDSAIHSEYYSLIEKMNALSDKARIAEDIDVSEKDGYEYAVSQINKAKENTLNNISPKILPEVFTEYIKDAVGAQKTVLRLYANTKNPFDYQNPQHVESLINNMKELKDVDESEYVSIKLGNGNVFGQTKREYINMVKRGSWPAIESPQAQEAIIKLKHDGFYVAEGGEKNLAVYSSNQLKSVTDNNGDFGIDIPKFKEQKFPTESQINQQANDENKEFLTVVRRRLVKLGIDGRDADAQVLRDRNTLVDPTEFEAARKAAGDLFAMTIFDPAVSSLPPVEVAKLLADKMETIGNLPSRIYFAGNVHSYIDDMVTSKKIGKRLREQLSTVANDVVVRMAQMGREYGQASAMFARVYADFKKFDFLVNVKKMQLDTQAELNSKTTEDGTTVKDAIEEVREETEKILETTPELKELIELAAEVNDINLKDHGDKVAQGDIRGTSDPVMYTAEQFIEQQNKFNDAISDLQDKVTDLEAKLKKATDQYIKEQGKNAKLTKEISDLRDQIVNLNALIDKLRDSNKKLSADKSRYKSQLDALRNKFANLKALLKILKANKNISKQREEKMMAALVDMIAGGRLNDPDFDSVFAEVFNIGYMTSKDKAALESLANGLKYLSENPNSEISQIYIKRFNDYLESVSTEPWNAYRVATLLQGAFYHSVLSGVSTFFNATFGSMFTAMPSAAAYSFANILFNPKTALGSIVYGMKRMIEETKTAVSKGVFNQRAYDNMGTSWSGENLTDRADLAEVHLVNGFLNNLDKYRRSTTGVAKLKNGLAVVGSLVYQLAHFKRLMMFIDPTVTHMLSSYLQGSVEYRKAAEEMRAMRAAGTAPKEMLDAMATWAPFISPKWMRKIDEHVNYTKNDRADAAKQAQKEIDEMAKHGIKARPFYSRRRTSEIMRERMGKEMALEIDKVSRDWLMMWRPDGAIGYVWEKASKRLAIPQDATGLEAFMKTMLGITAFAFFRITAAGVNIVQSSIPIVGIGLSMYGIRKNFESNSKGKTMWGIGRKYKTESKTALGALKPSSIYKDLKDPKDFESFRVVTRLGISTLSTLTMALVMMNMFEFWDDEEEEGAEYVDIPLIGRARLDPDRWIDITASGTGAGSKDQGMQEGRTSFAVRFRLGKDAEWSRWMSTRLWPHMMVPVALIGRMADDAKGVYYDPKQSKKTAKPAEGIVEYAGEIPLALGEMSFNTIGRTYSQFQYDPTGALTKFALSPWYAVAQPRLANDVIVSANDALDLPKKDIYTGQGAKDVLKNMTYSLYGMDRFLSDDATDQFGIPLKSINPVTNWWTYVNDESLRSKEHPEWNLVYRYQNTNMPSQRGFVIEKVERTDKDGYLIDSEKKKYMSEYEKYVELNSDERKLAIQGVKSLFRNQILLMYENLPNLASEYKGSDYIDEGEIVSEKLEQTLSWAKEEMSNAMITIANEKDPAKKQLLMEGVFKEMQKMNKESDEMVREILSSGKLPKTGLGRDAKKMAPIL